MKNLQNLPIVLQYLYPNGHPPFDYSIIYDSKDYLIAKWNTAKLGEQPTQQVIDANEDAAVLATIPVQNKAILREKILDAIVKAMATNKVPLDPIWQDIYTQLNADIAGVK